MGRGNRNWYVLLCLLSVPATYHLAQPKQADHTKKRGITRLPGTTEDSGADLIYNMARNWERNSIFQRSHY